MNIEKLTQDEQGKLHGGFLQAENEAQEECLWNQNCGDSNALINVNCGSCRARCGDLGEETMKQTTN